MNNYSHDELKNLLGSVGENVAIHRSVIFFSPKNIFLGSTVRIDCHCVLSAGEEGIYLGDYIHMGVAAHLFGSGGKITIESFVGVSSRVSLFTASDDYSDGYLANPIIPEQYRKVDKGSILIERQGLVGCGSIVFPGITIGKGAAVGAMSLVKNDVAPGDLVAGIPAKKIGVRQSTEFLENAFLNSQHGARSH